MGSFLGGVMQGVVYIITKTRREFLDWCTRNETNPTSRDVIWINDFDSAFMKLQGVENPKVIFYGAPHLIDRIGDIHRLILSRMFPTSK
jgi:hypothetical protein